MERTLYHDSSKTMDDSAQHGSPHRGRFDPMSGDWPIVAFDVCIVIILSSLSLLLAEQIAPAGWLWPVFWAIAALVIFVGLALPLRFFLQRQQQQAIRREQMLLDEASLREFSAQVSRGFDMADDEPAAYALARQATAKLFPDERIEVMVADSSRAHLSLQTARGPEDSPAGCQVLMPNSCPAVRSSHTMHFTSNSQLDTCSWLAEREPCGAVCAPISIMGATVGVVHVAYRLDNPVSPRSVDGLELVARQLGARVGMISSMAESRLQADTDPLTGLANRRRLDNAVRDLTRDGTPYALVLADLDHFKHLNDTYGHEMGDRALRLFARILSRNMRDGDLAARYGGEEFVVICPNSTASAAADAFDRVRLELAVAVSDGRTPTFTVSAGVSDTTRNSRFDELMRAADELLLAAKRNGRDQTLLDVPSRDASHLA